MSKVSLCPTCRKAVPIISELRPKTFPFCTERCQLVDLGKWFDGSHVLPEPIGPDDYEALAQVVAERQGEG